MRRIRVVLCLVLVMAVLAMSAVPAAAGSKRQSTRESSAHLPITGAVSTTLTEVGAPGGTRGY